MHALLDRGARLQLCTALGPAILLALWLHLSASAAVSNAVICLALH